ncbi:MAG TPA: sugar phosphate nucleotidyltransferase [Steroidobacteraceae bacterium]
MFPQIHSDDRGFGATWALVLAGGAGSRLRFLTTTESGAVIPKQFCSLRRGPSLLTQSLIRAGSVAPPDRTCAVVASQHRWCWESPLSGLPADNIFVQPENRGTAHGILLGLLRIEAKDPRATVLMLPADHYVRHEDLLARSLRQAVDLAAQSEDAVCLLGAEPDRVDTELGYIVPVERKAKGATRVISFVEKPDADRAARLLELGALWNMFIIAGSVGALLELYEAAHGASVDWMREAMGQPALTAAYGDLRMVDFSRDLLEPQASKVRVLRVPPCGWNDLGTPKRVIETLHDLPSGSRHVEEAPYASAKLSLADQYERLTRGRSLSSLA